LPGLGTGVKGRINILCVRDAVNLPLRDTVNTGWQFSSGLCLVKNRTLLLELRIVRNLCSRAPAWFLGSRANECFGGKGEQSVQELGAPHAMVKVRRNNRKCIDVVGRDRNCICYF